MFEFWKRFGLVYITRRDNGRLVTWHRVTDAYRYTLGTNISDARVPLSFNGQFFKLDEKFDYTDEAMCYKVFAREVEKAMQLLHPRKHYTLDDVLGGDWGGLLREEHNARAPILTPVHGEFVFEALTPVHGEFVFEAFKNWRVVYSNGGLWN